MTRRCGSSAGSGRSLARRPEPRTYSYDVIPRDDLMGPFVRRLYVRLHLAGRQRRRTHGVVP